MRANDLHQGPSVVHISGGVASVVGNYFALDDGSVIRIRTGPGRPPWAEE